MCHLQKDRITEEAKITWKSIFNRLKKTTETTRTTRFFFYSKRLFYIENAIELGLEIWILLAFCIRIEFILYKNNNDDSIEIRFFWQMLLVRLYNCACCDFVCFIRYMSVRSTNNTNQTNILIYLGSTEVFT